MRFARSANRIKRRMRCALGGTLPEQGELGARCRYSVDHGGIMRFLSNTGLPIADYKIWNPIPALEIFELHVRDRDLVSAALTNVPPKVL
jgi:hypothetical protein